MTGLTSASVSSFALLPLHRFICSTSCMPCDNRLASSTPRSGTHLQTPVAASVVEKDILMAEHHLDWHDSVERTASK